MALFNFTKPERDAIVRKIQDYAARELDHELGQIDASFLLNFFAEEIGPYFYNKAIHDSQAVLMKRVEEIAGALEELEKPTGRR